MSRFFALALIPDNLNEKDATDFLIKLLAPHDEQYDYFDSYRRPCECALDDVYEALQTVEREVGDFRELWFSYHSLPVEERIAWREYIAPWEDVYLEVAKGSPYYEEPNSDCRWCKGTGVIMATSASGGHYDYWRTDDGLSVKFDSPHVWHVTELPHDMNELECGVIVTPEGRWNEAPGGCWSYQDSKWQEIASSLLDAHSNCRAVRFLFHN